MQLFHPGFIHCYIALTLGKVAILHTVFFRLLYKLRLLQLTFLVCPYITCLRLNEENYLLDPTVFIVPLSLKYSWNTHEFEKKTCLFFIFFRTLDDKHSSALFLLNRKTCSHDLRRALSLAYKLFLRYFDICKAIPTFILTCTYMRLLKKFPHFFTYSSLSFSDIPCVFLFTSSYTARIAWFLFVCTSLVLAL